MSSVIPTLRGQISFLRAFAAADITDRYVSWLNEPSVVRFSNQRFVRHDRDSCLRYLGSFAGSDNLFVSVHRLDTGEPVGTMTAYVSRHHGTADVGILIGETAVWGRGYGQDAWNVLINWLLRERQLRKVTAGALACNFGMIKLMQRSGMHQEAVRKAQEIVEGAPQDIVYYARFNDG